MNNKENIKIGLAETIITPKQNLQMHGFGKSQIAEGVHDELHSRCLIVEDAAGNRFAIISISVVELNSGKIPKIIRRKIAEEINIHEEAILLSCTHTHSGPEVEIAPYDYQEFFINQIVESAKLANRKLVPAKIGIGKTVQLEVGKNRRRLPYGGLHPDPELDIIRIEDISGKLQGVLFSYGCHPATLDWKNRLYSEDWPYFAIKGIKEHVGKDVWVCYLQAAQGNINTGYDSLLSAIGADMQVRNYAYIKYKGKQMSDSVLEILSDIKVKSNLTVEVVNKYFPLPLRKEFPVTLEEAKRNLKTAKKKLSEIENEAKYKSSRKLDSYRTQVISAEQTFELAKEFYSGELQDSEIVESQVFRVGDIVFFSLPGEVFSEIALSIKKQSPFNNTIPVGLANCRWEYMPTKEEFIEGDYEVDGSKYSPEVAEVFINSTLKIINFLYAQEKN